MRYRINSKAVGGAPLRKAPASDAEIIVTLLRHTPLLAEPDPDMRDGPEWTRVKTKDRGTQEMGWVETRFLEADIDTIVPLEQELFVRECARAERKINGCGAADPFPIVGDYLIAWSLLETGMKNLPADPARGGASGPFGITDTEWNRFLASGSGLADVAGGFREIPNLHVYPAAFLSQDHMRQFSEKFNRPDTTDGPYVPSYLNVLHCQLIGVETACRLQEQMDKGEQNSPLEPALRQRITERLKQTRLKDLSPPTVGEFFKVTAQALNDALAQAADLITAHFPEIQPDANLLTHPAPWFAIAKRERDYWQANDLDETQPAGTQRVMEYFKATDFNTTPVKPWCGAFVAYCLAKAGTPFEKRGSARAAHWKGWGTTELRLRPAGNDPIPQGAIVVTAPLAKGSSGHVAFFNRSVNAERIELLGGNQDNCVSFMELGKDKIVAIRWLDSTGVTEGAGEGNIIPGAAVEGATEQDVLILAQTIYGEACDQGHDGQVAVANVILNRLKDNRRPKKIRDVCLQHRQFSCWNHNDPNFRKICNKQPGSGDDVFDDCYEIARRAVQGNLPNKVGNATHYHANYISKPYWADGIEPIKEIGRHLFYSGIV